MTAKKLPLAFLLLSLLATFGCAGQKTFSNFDHRYHRDRYSLSEENLRSLSFYSSTDILAKGVDPQNPGGGERVFTLSKETPGLVVEAGPDFLRVSFREGGVGALFLADSTEQYNVFYYLATEVQDGSFQKLEDVKDGVLRQDGVEFKIMTGRSAHLVVDWKEFKDLLESLSVRLEGRTQ